MPSTRADDAADHQRAEHDQHRRAAADGARPGRVGDAGGGRGGDQQGDQAEPVGDHVPGALAQPVPDEHADAPCRASTVAMLTTVPIPGNTASSSLVPRSSTGRIRPATQFGPHLGVISHLGPVRELSGARARPDRTAGVRGLLRRRSTGWKGCPRVPQPGAVRDAAPDDAARPGRGLGRRR